MNSLSASLSRKSFYQRWTLPVATALGSSSFLFFFSFNLVWIEEVEIYRLAMNGVHLLLFISVAFGTLYLYPWMFSRRASLPERITGSLITPLAFIVKEVIRVREYFTWGESLYYAVSPVMLFLLIGQIGLMGIAEIFCRSAMDRRADPWRKVVSPGPIVSILVSLAALYVFLLWGMGVHWFYIYMKGYKALFS
jgi:hypothetical protein